MYRKRDYRTSPNRTQGERRGGFALFYSHKAHLMWNFFIVSVKFISVQMDFLIKKSNLRQCVSWETSPVVTDSWTHGPRFTRPEFEINLGQGLYRMSHEHLKLEFWWANLRAWEVVWTCCHPLRAPYEQRWWIKGIKMLEKIYVYKLYSINIHFTCINIEQKFDLSKSNT